MFEELQNIIHTLEATQGNARLIMVFTLSLITLTIVAGVWLFIVWLYRLPELGAVGTVTLFFLGTIAHCIFWYQLASPAIESAGATSGVVGRIITGFFWLVFTVGSYIFTFYAACGVHYKIAQARP